MNISKRPNQLEDYKRILGGKNVSSRHLVYLTKYYDLRENKSKSIHLHLIKWYDIYHTIDESNTQLSQELKSYLKDENMEESKNFTYSDVTALKTITGTIRKMNEVLDNITEYYDRKIGSLVKGSSPRSTGMKDEFYVAYQYFEHPPN